MMSLNKKDKNELKRKLIDKSELGKRANKKKIKKIKMI